MKAWFGLVFVVAALVFAGCGGNGQPKGDAGTDAGTDAGIDSGIDAGGLPVCGDDIVSGSEQCEPNVDEGCLPVGHVDECQFIPAAFRWRTFGIADPEVYATNGEVCGAALNQIILKPVLNKTSRGDKPDSLVDADALDGLVDIGFVVKFSPIAQGDGESTEGEFVVSDCNVIEPAPSAAGGPTPCSPSVINDPARASFTLTTQASGTCLEPLPGTTDFPVPTVEAGDNGCFVSDPFDVTISLGSVVSIPLTDARIAAQWQEDPATGLENGLVSGFISEADAEAIVIDFAAIQGQTLAQTLSPLNEPPCNHRDEKDGVVGWWVYFKFSAEPVPWQGNPMCGNGVLDTGGDERDELCDIGIESGEGTCDGFLECDDGIECTQDTINVGDACAPVCFRRGIRNETDGCCPALGQPDQTTGPSGFLTLPNRDADCIALCGDGTVDNYEVCDDGDGSPTPCDDEAGHCPGGGYDATNPCTCGPAG